MYPFRRLAMPILIITMVIVVGASYYVIGEGWGLIDAIYMVAITISTVGFMEVRHLSDFGRIVTIGIILIGVGTVAYTVGQVIEIMFEGQIIGYRRKKEMEKKISELKNHYIICGFGRVGHQVAFEFNIKKIPYVVIDSKQETAEELGGTKVPYIIGDISSDIVLESAGVKKAKGLIACADSDTSNVYVILAARVMNPKLDIVARAAHVESENKMLRAGANAVISPYFMAGRRMAATIMKPVACQFLDTVIHGEHIELEMEEYLVHGNSKLIGKTLSDLKIKQNSGALIVAIKKSSGKLNVQPGANTEVGDGDILVALGASESLGKLRNMVG